MFSITTPLLVWLLSTALTSAADDTFNILKATAISKPGCPSKCGNLTVPYPFGVGIGSGCALDKGFELNCTNAFKPSRVFNGNNIQVYEISDNRLRISTVVARKCYDRNGFLVEDNPASSDMRGTPFSYSDLNKFTTVGCDYQGLMTSFSFNLTAMCNSGCIIAVGDVTEGECTTINGCCQTPLDPKGPQYYYTLLSSLRNHIFSLPNACGYAFLGEQGSYRFQVKDRSDANFMDRILATVPMVLDWAIGNLSCKQVQVNNTSGYACKANTYCVDSGTALGGYRCSCDDGYQGNPYLDPGAGFGFLLLLMVVTCLYLYIKKRNVLKLRGKFFKRNGGFILKQRISLKEEGSVESTKVYTAEELKKATNSYADNRIIGRGGYGTVYKGILPDKTLVAIKKSTIMDETQIEQFINEVIILTQINHRNVVKLLGCCLESEVPILVYEYVSNGTLFEYIHNNETSTNWLSWENRLRIASEAAGALSYLHSAASTPIIHRDVKSTNILLDEYYTAKISDFGASRLIPLDQNKVTTMVIGTFGYLDPEYFHTSHLTEKSDVYSFGVVLVELLTGQKPVDMEKSEDQRSLTVFFITHLNENRLFQILEARVVREGSLEQLQAMAELIKRCLHLNREDRPTMKEVATELESLRKFTKITWTHKSDNEEPVSVTGSNLYTVPVEYVF